MPPQPPLVPASTMTTPVEWMPGVFDLPTDGVPLRHRPVTRSHDDVWRARCGTICFVFRPLSAVLELCPACPDCETAETPAAPGS